MQKSIGLAVAVAAVAGIATEEMDVFLGCAAAGTVLLGIGWMLECSRIRRIEGLEYKPSQLRLLALVLHEDEPEKIRLKDEKRLHLWWGCGRR